VLIPLRHPELDSGSIHRGSSPKCHCEERSDEAIQETKISIDKMNTKTELLTFRLPRFARNDKGEKRAAFTLAEVLITLAIIGVVAVMTIPTLISDYQKQVTVTKLKVTYSTINQALRLSAIDNGPVSNWDRNILEEDVDWTYDETLDWFNKYLAPYLRYSKIEKFSVGTYVGANGEELPDDYLLVYLNNGVILRLEAKDPYDTYFVFHDGKKFGTIGLDVFAMRFAALGRNLQLQPYFPSSLAETWDGSLESLKNGSYGCYNGGMLCTKLIQENGWKIPDDYPYFK